MNIESVMLLRNGAKENIKQFCKKENEDFNEVWNYILKEVDKFNMLEPIEFYRRVYNESVTYK